MRFDDVLRLKGWMVFTALFAAVAFTCGATLLSTRILGLFFVLWFSMLLPIGAWWAQERARAVAGAR